MCEGGGLRVVGLQVIKCKPKKRSFSIIITTFSIYKFVCLYNFSFNETYSEGYGSNMNMWYMCGNRVV